MSTVRMVAPSGVTGVVHGRNGYNYSIGANGVIAAVQQVDVLDLLGAGWSFGSIDGGLRIARGQLTTVTAADTVITGLATVVSVTASFETDPADANMFVSAQVGDQAGAPAAGSIIVKTWKSADGTDPTPVAASSFSKKVNWVAIGT